MSAVLPERIAQARELQGLTKTEIASALGVSPAAVAQWESGVKSPTAENLALLAREVGFPIAAFQRAQPVGFSQPGPLSFRARSNGTTRRANVRAEQLAKLVAEAYVWLSERVALPLPNLPDVGAPGISPEEAAQACRRAWNLGDRPILKLGELLESQGIIVARASLGDEKLDAFSCLVSGRPFVFLGSDKLDRARSRFDAAHELAHLILHQHYTERHLSDADDHKELEQQANAFASAFLMPATTFGQEIFDTTLNGFLRLKERWGVSVQAMVVRSFQLGLIDEHRRTELFRQMSAKGWRKARGEPLDNLVPEVNRSVGKRSIELLTQNGVIHLWEIPNEIPFPDEVLHVAFNITPESLHDAVAPNVVLFPAKTGE
ncbi:MAG: ImmA/IrrE family metallo-endopeptidase [Dechloromonas sp.]|nr:MAG: ImmA/IrrE family metallo-endopeptidase [Dechloromonas sp.]